jgi:3-oxocholest-4-en-26-oate---CoA ligase
VTGLNFTSIQLAVAESVPDRAALTWRDRVISHRDLADRTLRFANVLEAMALDPREGAKSGPRWHCDLPRVAMVMRNRPEFIECLLGICAARAVAVNVNYRYTSSEIAQVLEVTKPSAIVFEADFEDTVTMALSQLATPPTVRFRIGSRCGDESLDAVTAYETALAHSTSHGLDGPPAAGDLYLLMTGGTTGAPKAVLWRQEDLLVAALGGWDARQQRPLRSVDDWMARLSQHPTVTVAAPPFMHGAAQWCALSSLFTGGTVAIQDQVDRFDAGDVLDTVSRSRAAMLMIAGDAFALPLIRALDATPRDLTSLRFVLSGAVSLSASAKSAIGKRLPRVTVMERAGASESGTQLVARTADVPHERATVFDPSPGTLLLAEDRRTVLTDCQSIGWLARRTWVPLAYLDDETATLESFPVIDGIRYAVAGDRARYNPSGGIELLGRQSQVINTGGEKVFAEEVERALRSYPDVEDALVVGVPSQHWGVEVAAVIEVAPGARLDEIALRHWVGSSIARYKLPKSIRVVDKVVRTPAGKPDYRWARTQLDAD